MYKEMISPKSTNRISPFGLLTHIDFRKTRSHRKEVCKWVLELGNTLNNNHLNILYYYYYMYKLMIYKGLCSIQMMTTIIIFFLLFILYRRFIYDRMYCYKEHS